MKMDQINVEEQVIFTDLKFQQKNYKQQNHLTCTQKNKIYLGCINSSCSTNGFVCLNLKCQCRKQHKGCLFVQIESLYEEILKKIISLKPIQQFIEEKIDKSIDMLSRLRDEISGFIQEKLKLFGLSKQQLQFVNAIGKKCMRKDLQNEASGEDKIQDNERNQATNRVKNNKLITGKKIDYLCEQLKRQSKSLALLSNIQQRIEFIWKGFDKQFEKTSAQLLQQIEKFQKVFQTSNINQLFNEILFENSAVIKTRQDVFNLTNFFDNKAVKKTNLLFRASENDFLIEKFFEKCSYIPNTLIVLQTQFGKILGGYTPLQWYQSQQVQYQKDLTCSSFLFSLTNNDKFVQVSKDRTIQRGGCCQYGPSFGDQMNSNLYIWDKANQNQFSSFYICNENFYNNNYRQNNGETYEKLSGNGNNSAKFKIKEWEVWGIGFE